eukprot:scaffold4412_cov401-Prasinococcus_capsulatus_cf.AAC.18
MCEVRGQPVKAYWASTGSGSRRAGEARGAPDQRPGAAAPHRHHAAAARDVCVLRCTRRDARPRPAGVVCRPPQRPTSSGKEAGRRAARAQRGSAARRSGHPASGGRGARMARARRERGSEA